MRFFGEMAAARRVAKGERKQKMNCQAGEEGERGWQKTRETGDINDLKDRAGEEGSSSPFVSELWRITEKCELVRLPIIDISGRKTVPSTIWNLFPLCIEEA